MGITTKRTGPPVRFDSEKAIRLIAGYVPGAIIRRTAQGLDTHGQPFAPYTPRYRQTLAKMGEDQSEDLRLTGGLMNSVKVREKRITAAGVEVVIAPDTGTSPQVRAPSETRAYRKAGLVFGTFGEGSSPRPLRRGEARQLERDLKRESGKRAIRTGQQGPPHNVLGYWLHHGTPHMRARPFMGLSPDQQAELNQILARARLWG